MAADMPTEFEPATGALKVPRDPLDGDSEYMMRKRRMDSLDIVTVAALKRRARVNGLYVRIPAPSPEVARRRVGSARCCRQAPLRCACP